MFMAFYIFYCLLLLKLSKAKTMHYSSSCEVRVHKLFLMFAIQLIFTSVILSVLIRMGDIKNRIILLPVNYLSGFVGKVIIFFIIRKFSPAFEIRSEIENN